MARIPRYTLWYRGERVPMVYLFALDEPILEVTFDSEQSTVTVGIANRQDGCIYFYTLDGSDPTSEDARMEGTLTLTDACVLRVKAYRGKDESPVAGLEIGRVATPVIDITEGGGGDEPTGGDYITENEVHFTSASFSEVPSGGAIMKAMHMEGICDWLNGKTVTSIDQMPNGLTGVLKNGSRELPLAMAQYLNQGGIYCQIIFASGSDEDTGIIVVCTDSSQLVEMTPTDDVILAYSLPEWMTDFEVTLNWNST